MKWSDKFGNSMFSKDASGDTVFYPWAMFGKGYIVSKQESMDRIRKILRQSYMVGMIFMLVVIISSSRISDSTTFVLGIMTVYTFWYYWNMSEVTKELAVSNKRLTFKEYCKNASLNFNMLFLVIAEACTVVIFLMAFSLFVTDNGMLMGLVGLLIFGFTGAITGGMIYCKLKEPK